MTIQAKEGNKVMTSTASNEMKEEMVGVLTAISIVSKRLANRLTQLDENEKRGERNHE